MGRESPEPHKKFTEAIDSLNMIVTDKGEMQNSFANTKKYNAR
jgi:hypothetical protein